MKYYTIALCVGLALHANAAIDPFEELDNEVSKAFISPEQEQAEFEAWYIAHMQEYAAWRSAYLKKWDAEREASLVSWGDTKIGASHYSVKQNPEKDTRTIVDYDNDTVTVEVLVDANASAEEVSQLLKSELAGAEVDHQILESTAKIDTVERVVSYDVENEKKVLREIVEQTEAQLNEIEKQADQLAMQADVEVDESIVKAQQQALVVEAKQRMASVNETYEKQRKEAQEQPVAAKKVVSLSVKMPSSSLERRIEPFLDDVYKQSEEFNIKPELILAVMHTESSFNPAARSPIPAFGLMQVVATSAGHDVNRFVHKIDAPMNERDLYKPEYNIQAGTGYLDILNTRYLREITNPKSREYCIIAAYNTGAGNVAKAFGERRIKAAAKKINTMTPDEVYNTLINNLPYDETINYLKKVTKRQRDYSAEVIE
ncbi:transglycosylase SLT domain-containing protein [Vibrio maritimus]|uniref:transglycosylase SLT domain-containing protein n=1 Tax=Vibrio maritimus TaxID=990268 RepID=UPI001F244155|nr:transglycosylase SLT domain-containing protein [Vibrio maritimus]